ncbi:MAG: DinB family protein [Actinomycetia bacterium]|nr:DinB family protein [Actinomycetes bacterium]
MAETEHKDDLHGYLTRARKALLWKLDGLSDYDVRRPLVPTGTNLLGVVKHVGSVAAGYFGECFGRPFPEPLPWFADDAEPNADLWAKTEESRDFIVRFYGRAWAHADATIEALPLDATANVSWWPEGKNTPTLHTLLVHMTAETFRHAGHADIVRELIDGSVGWRDGNSNLPDLDDRAWVKYHDRLEAVAQQFRKV